MKYVALTVLMALSGCAGKIYTIQNPQFINGKTEGVLFHGYKTVEKKVILDRIRQEKTGEITHSMYETPGTTKYCAPDVSTTQVVVADFSTSYAIKYEPGLFETNKFSVGLENGTLKSVNSESTPGVKTAVESLQGLATLREDVLDGFIDLTNSNANKALTSINSNSFINTPIKCSASK